MKLNQQQKEIINRKLKNAFGMTYEEYESLDYDSQRNLLKLLKKEEKKSKKSNRILVMIGSGENSIFVKLKKGTRYMLEDGSLIRSGTDFIREDENIDNKITHIISKTKRKTIHTNRK